MPFHLRDRRIKAVEDAFNRKPTANELRAIDALPLERRRNLNDTSENGQRIYSLLKEFEVDGHVEALEEAGAVLWEQIFAKPEFSRRSSAEPVSVTRDLARTANVEARNMGNQKPVQLSSFERVASTNATSKDFADSSQKSWITTGVPVPPSPLRSNSSLTQRDSYSDATHSKTQSSTPTIPLCLEQPDYRNQSHTSNSAKQIPGGSPDIYHCGVYTPWPLRPKSQEAQFASPYSNQVPSNSISPVPERVNPAQTLMSRSTCSPRLENKTPAYNPSTANLYDPARSPHFASSERTESELRSSSNPTPQYPAREYPESGTSTPSMHHKYYSPQDPNRLTKLTVPPNRPTNSGRPIYDPSTPPFHPALTTQAQQLLLTRKTAEESEVSRLTSSIHRSLAKLPNNRGNQGVASSSTMYQFHSSTTTAANTLENISNTGLKTQLSMPGPSIHQDSSPVTTTPSEAPAEMRKNPFVIRDGVFVRTFHPGSGA